MKLKTGEDVQTDDAVMPGRTRPFVQEDVAL